ncbi:MAG: sulfide/dihydroorotate dehydrogenase-like FAD/NAD-binding protein [Thermoprotei archaeon]|nr:MAG: sulfide/dihydroorotate dehydrogenase-like FAD/NAD-binding protein [Thermoprotei archaeon]
MLRWEVVSKRELAPQIKALRIYAPEVAKTAKPGQFVILMVDEKGERIPLTLADWSEETGLIELVFLEVGVSTLKLGMKRPGERLYYLVGPLGNPSDIRPYKKVVLVGGGVGAPALYPIARAFNQLKSYVITIIGARTSHLLVYEEKLRSVSDEIYITTDDGSRGIRGFTSDALEMVLNEEKDVDAVWLVGPAVMMKVCSEITKRYGVRTFASLNPIMVCGVGMCGACRVSVDGKIMFTCIDGPEFDAHKVNWDELIARLAMYRKEEEHALRLFKRRISIKGVSDA